RPSSPPKRTGTPPPSTSARRAPGTSTSSPPRSTPTARPWRWPAPPKPRSSTDLSFTSRRNPRFVSRPHATVARNVGLRRKRWVSAHHRRTPIMTTPTLTAPTPTQQGPSIEVTGPQRDRFDEILTPEALAFLTELHHRFAARRHDRLADRMRRRFEIGNGHDPRFREDTAHIREDRDWRVAGAGPGLEDRRV